MNGLAELSPPVTAGLLRHADWAVHLSAHVQAARAQPFVWGQHDCCSFAANAVLAMTGCDPMAVLRGRYTNGRDATRLLRELGGLRQAVTDRLGDPVKPVHAGRGDVVLFDTQIFGEALGICLGAHFAAPGPRRLEMIDMSKALAAWKVSP